MTAPEYEQLVMAVLAKQIEAEWPHGEPRIFHNRKYKGRSGHESQIDIAAELDLAGVRVLIVVECKKYNRRIDNGEVREFADRLRDIAAHKGIMVTTVGFQEGAQMVAEAAGIALVLTPPTDAGSWKVLLPSLLPALLLADATHTANAAELRSSATAQWLRRKVEITSPQHGSSVPERLRIQGTTSFGRSAPWVIVHPRGQPECWVQPPTDVDSSGSWSGDIYIGRTGNADVGKEFDILAVINPRTSLATGQVLKGWPKAQEASRVIRVRRK